MVRYVLLFLEIGYSVVTGHTFETGKFVSHAIDMWYRNLKL